MDSLVQYVDELEGALLSAPFLPREEAFTIQEKTQVRRQYDWLEKHRSVIERANGARPQANVKQQLAAKVSLRQNQVRIMNERHRRGDPNSYAINADLAFQLILEDLNSL